MPRSVKSLTLPPTAPKLPVAVSNEIALFMTAVPDPDTVPQARSTAKQEHPLGPRFYRLESPNPRAAEAWALLVVVLCGAALGLAGVLSPDTRGFGTHSTLGLPECGLMLTTGYPCPTCGMTTAFAFGVRGRWLTAIRIQPVGWLLCVATMATAGLALSVLISGKAWHVNWYRISPTRLVLAVVGLLLAGWVYKIVAVVLDRSSSATW